MTEVVQPPNADRRQHPAVDAGDDACRGCPGPSVVSDYAGDPPPENGITASAS